PGRGRARPPGAGERDVTAAEPADLAGGLADRGRDVVELQVEEHPPVGAGQLLDGRRAGGGEQFEADFDNTEPGMQPVGQGDGGGEVVDVERQGEAIPRPGHHWRPPTRSALRATPCSAHQRARPATTPWAARGSKNVAVPTPTALAPARSISTASRPVRTPPVPIIGVPGRA